MRRIDCKNWLLGMVCLIAVCVGFISCNKDDDDGWKTVKQELVGEWATDTWDGTQPQDIVQYRAEIKGVKERGSMLPYAIYGIRKDSQQVIKEQGYIGHPNDEADNVFEFCDYYHGTARRRTITWLDNAHTSTVLYDEKVFYKSR